MKKTIWILGLLTVVALFLRVNSIAKNPPGLSWDEISIGYNAYSILKTGKDEHQRFLPLDTFIAFGDYKPPVAIYATVPFIAVFGLTDLAVRLPSALFGTATVFLTFFLVKELFKKKKYHSSLAWLTTAILTFSPWHINLSRAGFEGNIALFWVVLGIFVLLKARDNAKFLWVGWIPFVVAIYTFNSSRYFAPLFAPVILWTLKGSIQKHKRACIGGIVIATLLMVPIIPHLVSPQSRLRFQEVNIFSDPSIVEVSNQRIAQAGNTWWANIIDNRRVGYIQAFAKHYLDHFDPSYLFLKGDGNPKFSIQDVGQLYLIELPFLLIGIIALFKEEPGIALFLVAWLGLAIIPAATARETPHALRTLNTLPTWQIFIAFGIFSVYQSLKSQYKKLFVIILTLLFLGNIGYYLHNYYRHYPYEYSGEWQYGYREAITYAESVKGQYHHIVVSDIIGRPYIYTLFYGKYDPKEFWHTKIDSFDAAGFYHVYSFGQYEFPDGGVKSFEKNTLYILPPENMPKGATIKQTIKLLNGTTVLVAFEL